MKDVTFEIGDLVVFVDMSNVLYLHADQGVKVGDIGCVCKLDGPFNAEVYIELLSGKGKGKSPISWYKWRLRKIATLDKENVSAVTNMLEL
jgi:hypothetical protein